MGLIFELVKEQIALEALKEEVSMASNLLGLEKVGVFLHKDIFPDAFERVLGDKEEVLSVISISGENLS